MARRRYAEPWERQIGEGEKAFQAFVTYRDLRWQRSFNETARTLGKSDSLIRRWAHNWGWRQRVLEFDRHEDRLRRAKLRHQAEKALKRHRRLAKSALAQVSEKLRTMCNPDGRPLSGGELDLKLVHKWLEAAVKVERQSLGLSTEKVSAAEAPSDDEVGGGQEIDFSELTNEEAEELDRLLAKAGGESVEAPEAAVSGEAEAESG